MEIIAESVEVVKLTFRGGFYYGKKLLPMVFNHEEFGQLRVFKINDVPWAVAADVAKILEIEQNFRNNLANFPDDEKGMYIIHTLGGPQKMLCVNEAGLYRLIFQSRKPEAEKFKHWIFHEVLPTLRKTGEYKMNSEKPKSAMTFEFYEGTGEGEFGKIPRFVVNGELVLTTAQLAKFYECSPQNIRKTFHLHKEKFIEGEHYFKLTGEALKDFKRHITESNLVTNANLPLLNLNASHFMLWTTLGAASFAKSLRTRKAWEVYEQLAVNYFSSKKIVGKKSAGKISKTELTPKEKVDRLIQLAKITKDSARRENLITIAEKIIIG